MSDKTKKRTNTHKGRDLPPRRLTASIPVRRAGKRCCSAVARSGKPCQAPPARGTKYCLFHTPGRASECGTKGGRRRAIFNPANLEPFTRPKNASDLVLLLAQTIVEVRSGKMDPRVANAITYLSTGYLSALETAELVARLDRLETRLGLVSRSNVATSLPN